MSASQIKWQSVTRFVVYSTIGATAFFVPIEFGGRSTILIDHIVTLITARVPLAANAYTVLMILSGVVAPFVAKTWRDSNTSVVLSILQILAIPLAAMYLSGVGPDVVMAPDVLPFLFEKLTVPVGLVIPIGAVFLSFLMGFGLLEVIGVFMEPIMRPVFKTPGRSAVDAVASFAGSYSVGLLITSRVYKTGMYSAKEAAIIATGFSTVSATFMVIVAKTLSLTEHWNAYFFGTLLVTFLVTAITVRLPPLAKMDNSSCADDDARGATKSYFKEAYCAGIKVANDAPKLTTLLIDNFVDGLRMAGQVVPSILSVGFLGVMAAKYTPIFELLGLLFAPMIWLFDAENAIQIGSIISIGFAEMFLPAVQGAVLDSSSRFVVGVVSVSSILFLSASIPCILATGIPITLGQMTYVWLLRTLFSIPLAYAVGWMFIDN